MTSFKLNNPLEGPISKNSPLRVRISTYGFEEDTGQSITMYIVGKNERTKISIISSHLKQIKLKISRRKEMIKIGQKPIKLKMGKQ